VASNPLSSKSRQPTRLICSPPSHHVFFLYPTMDADRPPSAPTSLPPYPRCPTGRRLLAVQRATACADPIVHRQATAHANPAAVTLPSIRPRRPPCRLACRRPHRPCRRLAGHRLRQHCRAAVFSPFGQPHCPPALPVPTLLPYARPSSPASAKPCTEEGPSPHYLLHPSIDLLFGVQRRWEEASTS
jgi:hypothetical protein